MKLYFAPGSCALGIHVLLEELGAAYTLEKVDFVSQAQHSPAFRLINSKSKVPVLERPDGSILTEFPAIAFWLALANPDKHLVPPDVEGQARTLELMDYVVATTHMQGFTRMVRPGNFTPRTEDEDRVKDRGLEIFQAGLNWLDGRMDGKTYAFDDTFTIADACLFYPEFWCAVRLGRKLPSNLARHFAAMTSRRSVLRAVEMEGLSLGVP